MPKSLWFAAIVLLTASVAGGVARADCNDPAGFPAWLEGVKRDAAAQGISQSAITSGLAGVTYDAAVVSHDRRQGVFRQSFEQFSGRMVPPRLAKGRQMMARHAALLARIEQQFGVPGGILVAIWGLETDFGAYLGKFSTIRAIATLAYDCRRPERFRPELFDVLRVVARGDMAPAQMRGAWAGEIGQTQFMPSSYMKYAIDYDGDGRRDLVRSVPDVLASTANYLKGYGWKRGAGFSPGQANFEVLLQWNKSQVYSKTIAYFAEQLGPTR
ncbi:MAG: lytic murein transglycosylase [Rhizobiales bacterium]|nr:lytic murein transglycosylase [Hyphomicrobiales bacterium]